MHRVRPSSRKARLTSVWSVVFLTLSLQVSTAGIRTRDARAGAGEDTSRTYLFLDFEDSLAGRWAIRPESPVSVTPLEIGVVANYDRNNASGGVLHCVLREGRAGGGLSYSFDENGLDPVPLRPRTRLAWNWKVSSVHNSNGFWVTLSMRNVRTGETCVVQHSNWVRFTHDAFVYWDPPLVWRYHTSLPFEYVDDRFGPVEADEWVIEEIRIYLSSSLGVEAWIDNVWLGEGPAPPYGDVSADAVTDDVVLPSEIQSFSYGPVDGDLVPDLVAVYQDRVEITVNPGLRHRSRGGRSSDAERRPPVVVERSDRTLRLIPHRGSGAVSIADVDGDGWSDLLIVFDDKLGNRLLLNKWTRRTMRHIEDRSGALAQFGQHHYGSAVADIDADGRLDVLLFNPFCRYGKFGGVRILKNAGDDGFDDWTRESGVYSEGAFSATFGDVSGDGLPDLFIGYQSCSRGNTSSGVRGPTLFLNTGSGRFQDETARLPLSDSLRVSGAVTGDFDKDADLDLYVVVYEDLNKTRVVRNRLFLNDGRGWFVDFTDASGSGCIDAGGSAIAEDFDNDGDVDLYVIRKRGANVYLRNCGDATFEDFTAHSSFMWQEGGAGGIGVDYDMDGDMDVALLQRDPPAHRILTNNLSGLGNSIRVVLRGIGNNRAGVGGKVYVYEPEGNSGELIGFKEAAISKGFGPSGPGALHFGIGNREAVDVVVEFPPLRDRGAFTVARKRVREGDTVVISENRNASDRLFHAGLWRTLRNSAETGVYSLPFAVFWALVGVSNVVCGLRWRWRAPAGRYEFGDAAAYAVGLVAIGAGLIRSWELTVMSGALAVGLMLSYRPVTRVAFRLIPARVRESLEDGVLAGITDARHMDSEFYFFKNTRALSDEELAGLVRRALKSLERIVIGMRVLDPGVHVSRLIREEIGYLRYCASMLEKDVTEGNGSGGKWRSEIEATRMRINTHLTTYRTALRARVSIDICETWGDFLEVVRPDALSYGVSVSADAPESIRGVRVYLREREFAYVFKNLFYNSLKAMEASASRRIEVAFDIRLPQLIIRWADTGRGIPSEIFDRLVNTPVPSTSGGSGQGLYGSGQALGKRDGEMRPLRRSADQGAVFEVRLHIVNEGGER